MGSPARLSGPPAKAPRLESRPARGIGSARHAQRTQRALERCGQMTRPYTLSAFALAPLEPIGGLVIST